MTRSRRRKPVNKRKAKRIRGETTSPQKLDVDNIPEESSTIDENGHPTSRTKRYPLPWMLSVVGIVMFADFSLPKSWVYAWTQAQTPPWASAIFLWPGLVATVTFIHACLATQTAAIVRDSTDRERSAVGSVYRVSAACSASGALCGTLLAFMAAARMPSDIKLTALASDLTMLGTVIGLAVAAPFYIFRTWEAIERLRTLSKRKRFELIVVLSVFDAWVSDTIIRSLFKSWGFLDYIVPLL